MVNYEYRDLVQEISAGQEHLRECSKTGSEVDFVRLTRTCNAINFYNTHKRNYTSQQQDGIDLLVSGLAKLCSPELLTK